MAHTNSNTAGDAGRRGGFEAPLGGIPSPPSSPSAGRPSLRARKRSGDAAFHITEECERLFCETLKTVFLVEKDTGLETSLLMDLRNTSSNVPIPQSTIVHHGQPTPSASPDGRLYPNTGGLLREYVEVWDYAGGARFRGFVAEKDDMRSMFIFFDREVVGMDLKPGYESHTPIRLSSHANRPLFRLMSLLELASSEHFACTQLVVGIDREADKEQVEDLSRDLGWVGFELSMLDPWTNEQGCISERYILLGMDV